MEQVFKLADSGAIEGISHEELNTFIKVLEKVNDNLLNILKEQTKMSKLKKTIKDENYIVRLIAYLIGLFIMTIGVSMSVKSNLGVSPVSSIPYTITCITGLEMGKATIVFHIFLVILQILILRKAFKIKNLLQVIVGVVFGYFTTFSNFLFSYLPTPENIIIRLIMMLLSTVIIAIGIFCICHQI